MPAGKADFYQAILHEIGHALGLYHAVNLTSQYKELMCYTIDATQFIPQNNRVNLNTYGTRSINGTSNVATQSGNINWTMSGLATLGSGNSPVSSPVINSHPFPQTICTGNNAIFSITATGTALTYQWEATSNGSTYYNVTNGSIHSGVTTNTLTITNPGTNFSGRRYRCKVMGTGSCESFSNDALLSIQ